MATYPARPRRWTRPEYGRLIEVGVFRPGEPVELLGGELIVSEPQGSAHYTAIGLVEDALRVALGPGWLVRSQGPIARSEEHTSELQSQSNLVCRLLLEKKNEQHIVNRIQKHPYRGPYDLLIYPAPSTS